MGRVSPRTFERLTAIALGALAAIVVTGGAVRVTGSGLGCPDWPTCAEGRLVAPLEYHAMVEFVNRVVTGVVSVVVVASVLASIWRAPRRRDLVWLSLGLVAGVLGQVVLGALVVLFHLAPPLVMGHFVVSMVLVANAVVLHERAREGSGPRLPIVAPEHLALGRVLLVAAAVAILLGTVVTGSGPHAGSHDGELVERLPFAVGDVARLHGIAVVVFLAITLVLLRQLWAAGAQERVQRRGRALLVVLVAQAAVGYVQYFTGVPAALVALHIAGATAVWIAAVRLVVGMRSAGAAEPTEAGVGHTLVPL